MNFWWAGSISMKLCHMIDKGMFWGGGRNMDPWKWIPDYVVLVRYFKKRHLIEPVLDLTGEILNWHGNRIPLVTYLKWWRSFKKFGRLVLPLLRNKWQKAYFGNREMNFKLMQLSLNKFNLHQTKTNLHHLQRGIVFICKKRIGWRVSGCWMCYTPPSRLLPLVKCA